MAASRIPGSVCASTEDYQVDDGTMCRQASSHPGPLVHGSATGRVSDMSESDKLLQAARMATPYLPAELQQQFAALFKPEALALTATALAVWGASHYFGVGEIFDGLLAIVGVAILGWQAIGAAKDLWAFFDGAFEAQSMEDLDEAARHLASAVTVIGVAVFTVLLMKKLGKGKSSGAATAEEAALAEQTLVNNLLERIMGSIKNVGTLPRKNVEQAVKFFRSSPNPLKEEKMAEYLRGIDLHKPIEVIELEPGTILAQSRAEGQSIGQWFTRSGVDRGRLGVSDGNKLDSSTAQKQLLFRTTEKVRVLKSRAGGINDHWTAGNKGNVKTPITAKDPVTGKLKLEAVKPAEPVGGGGEQYFILRDSGGRVPVTPVSE